jgi:type IV pilus assembly protein PilO
VAEKKARNTQSFEALPIPVKVGILVLIVGGLGAIYYGGFHMTLMEEIATAQGRARSLQRRATEAQERNAEFVRLREELAAREGLDRANLRALPETAETASFLQDLNRQAELAGLRILLVQPRPEEPSEHYVRLPVELRLEGRYHQLARFFNNVSGIDRLISMEDISMRRTSQRRRRGNADDADGEAQGPLLEVEVMATTYRRPASEAAAEGPEGGSS